MAERFMSGLVGAAYDAFPLENKHIVEGALTTLYGIGFIDYVYAQLVNECAQIVIGSGRVSESELKSMADSLLGANQLLQGFESVAKRLYTE